VSSDLLRCSITAKTARRKLISPMGSPSQGYLAR
jgi:hypothetical protein